MVLTEIISRQDIPAGLFNLVLGAGRDVGQRLVESPKVDAISFTGSVPVGKGSASAAIRNLTKVQMEMGSKNALAVMADADLDLAVSLAMGGIWGGRGRNAPRLRVGLFIKVYMMPSWTGFWLQPRR